LLRLSLGGRLAIIVVCSSLAAVLAVTVTAYRALSEDFQEILIEQQRQETQRVSTQVSQGLQTRLTLLEAFSTTMTDGEELLPLTQLEALLGRSSALKDMFSNGLLILDEDVTAIAEDRYTPKRIGTNYADRDHFARALQTRKSAISKPIIGRTTGVPLLSFVTPIESDDGDLLGFLAGSIDLTRSSLIPEEARRISRRQKADFMVVDTQNFLFVESEKTDEGIHPLPPPGENPLIDAALSGLGLGEVVKNNGERMIFATSHLERLGWLFIRAVPQAMANAPATRSFNEFFLISLMILMIIVPLGYLITRSAMRPLDRITQKIRQMSVAEEASARLTETGPPEVQNLARAFNQLQSERDGINQMREDFISNVSHELRTPLTSMNGALRLIASGTVGTLPDKAAEMSQLALRNGERLQLLISDLLDFNKLQAGELSVLRESQPLEPIIEQAIQSSHSLAREAGVRLVMECEPDLTLYTDAHRLRQVLDNLISNAIKFSPEQGKVLVRAERPGADTIRLTVSDEGPGVPEEFRARLFTRFAQAEAGTARSSKGTGLGLAICRELVSLLGGRIGAYNDRGAHFWVELPISAPGETEL
jgi:signal transduction histidine kinase